MVTVGTVGSVGLGQQATHVCCGVVMGQWLPPACLCGGLVVVVKCVEIGVCGKRGCR